jgi:hypothetical protein
METIVNKNKLDSFFLTFRFSKHLEMKETVLTLIAEQLPESLTTKDDYYSDSITNVDWSLSGDFSRPWVQYFKPDLDVILTNVFNACGYVYSNIAALWFQQYQTNDAHGWHTHSHNFTGVYYLDLPADAPKTQIVNPFTQEHILIPEVGEGDILIFPSYVIHRAPVIKEKINKTIISFNFNVNNITAPVMNKINELGEMY